MISDWKKIVLPPYRPKDLYSIFITLVIILVIPLTVLEVVTSRDNRSQASILKQKQASLTIKVAVKSPGEGATLAGVQQIQIEATDSHFPILSVSLQVDGKTLGTTNNPNSTDKFTTTVALDTNKVSNGAKNLVATATNSNGLTQASPILHVSILNRDSQPPSVGFSNLQDGFYINTNSTDIKISASDNNGIEKVSLYIDGTLAKDLTTEPYSYQWASIATGNHNLVATAKDFVGNTQTARLTIYKTAAKN